MNNDKINNTEIKILQYTTHICNIKIVLEMNRNILINQYLPKR